MLKKITLITYFLVAALYIKPSNNLSDINTFLSQFHKWNYETIGSKKLTKKITFDHRYTFELLLKTFDYILKIKNKSTLFSIELQKKSITFIVQNENKNIITANELSIIKKFEHACIMLAQNKNGECTLCSMFGVCPVPQKELPIKFKKSKLTDFITFMLVAKNLNWKINDLQSIEQWFTIHYKKNIVPIIAKLYLCIKKYPNLITIHTIQNNIKINLDKNIYSQISEQELINLIKKLYSIINE